MSNPKLIILDGVDSCGKSTQCKLLQEYYDAKLIVQPSETNKLGFLRNEVKNNTSYDPFARQLLHTISHIVDAYQDFRSTRNIIMDRCYLSTLVYSEITGVKDEDIDLMFKIHQNVYLPIVGGKYDVNIFVLDNPSKYDRPEESEDEFEKTITWNGTRDKYLSYYKLFKNNNVRLFSPDEKLHLLSVSDSSIEEVFQMITTTVGK